MILLFSCREGHGKPVQDTFGYQEVIASASDGGDQIIVILDKNVKAYYIEKIIDKKKSELYMSNNFMKIEDKGAWESYRRFFSENGTVLK